MAEKALAGSNCHFLDCVQPTAAQKQDCMGILGLERQLHSAQDLKIIAAQEGRATRQHPEQHHLCQEHCTAKHGVAARSFLTNIMNFSER